MLASAKLVHRENPIRHRRNRLSPFCIEKTTGCFLLGFFLFAVTGWGRCLWSVSVPKIYANKSYLESRWVNKQGSTDDDDDVESVATQRRFLQIGRRDPVMINRRKRNKNLDACLLVSNNALRNDICSKEDNIIPTVRNVNRKIPTPWPINIIQERWNNRRVSSSQSTSKKENTRALNDRGTSRSSPYPSMGALFLAYAKQQARIGFRQVSEISAQIWYNLPPSAPPLILLASIPRNVKLLEGRNAVSATSTDSLRRIIPVFSDPFARSIVLAGLGMAVVSWSNQELQRKRKLTPLALSAMSNEHGVKGGGRVSRVFLPPFLPEDVSEPEIDALLGTTMDKLNLSNAHDNNLAANGFEDSILSHVSPKIRRHLSGIYETTTTTSKLFVRNYYNDWLQGRAVRKREVAKIRRNRIFDELVALQVLKKRQVTSRKNLEPQPPVAVDSGAPELGYALITGASRGIGRAIAVELARWQVPLVLVARDVAKLAQLASDLEACYGVKCCILEADLSKANIAEKIHQATTEAGISVDILINNAGVASEGLAVDSKTSFVEQMVMVNSLTYAKLSLLYGRDMKEKRRGRILMISSMAGLCNASPNAAVYGACKAFGKSLALSMAKEMETYGVGVTCLIPGAVSGTDFRASSGTRKALCWYLPFYSRSPDIVAHQGVISLLDGDTQSIPGWQNRVFANIVRPIIPQRLEIMMVQLAFSPLKIPSLKNLLRHDAVNIHRDKVESSTTDDYTPNTLSSNGGSSWLSLKPRYKTQPPPRFLKLREDEQIEVETNSEKSKDGDLVTEEVPSSSSIMSNDLNSTKDEMSQEVTELNKNFIHQSDTTPSTRHASDRIENIGTISEKETKMIERQSESSVKKQRQQHCVDKVTYNSDDNNHVKERVVAKLDGKKREIFLSERKSSPKNKSEDYDGDKPRIASKQDNENITEGNRIESVRRPQRFGYDDDDDDKFSTRLGPITMKEQREVMSTKQTNANRREMQTIFI